jgi:lysophospholipid acyltransferase (LPLAT)-like uncharacterized protein
MRTTKIELLEMLKDFSDDAQIILTVRGSRTTDYEIDETIVVKSKDYGNVILIMDRLSE